MDPFAPAWLRIPPAPTAAATSSAAAHNGHSFRSSNGQSPTGRFESSRRSPDQQQLMVHGLRYGSSMNGGLRTSSLDDGHFEKGGSGCGGGNFTAGQWKGAPVGSMGPAAAAASHQLHLLTGDRMRAKAASVSESSRLSGRTAPGFSHNHHQHPQQQQHKMHGSSVNSHVGHVSCGTATTAAAGGGGGGVGASAGSKSIGMGNGVPDFRELASFQFHTRSGSFGSEAVNGSGGVGVGTGTGSGASSTDLGSSEDDISAAVAASALLSSRYPSSHLTHGLTRGMGNVSTAVPAAVRFQQEFPSLAPAPVVAPAASVVASEEGKTGTVWDSTAKLKVLGNSAGMKKLWAKSNGSSAPSDSAAPAPAATASSVVAALGKKSVAGVSAPALPVMEILVKNPKIHSSSRSDFFKSLRSSSSSNSSTVCTSASSTGSSVTATTSSARATCATGSEASSSLSSSISSPAERKDSCCTTSTTTVTDDVFTSQDSSDGKENIPQTEERNQAQPRPKSSSSAQIPIPGKVFSPVLQRQDQKQDEEEEDRWIGRSNDSILSSSLEAEQRLLKEMGWKEEDELYEPLTEDEVREFQDLVMARGKSVAGGSLLPSAADLMTSSKNWRNITGSWFPGPAAGRTVGNRNPALVRPPPSSQPPVSGRKSINSSLASPQFDDERSSSSDDSSSDDEDEEEDVVMGRVTAALTGAVTRFPHHPIS